MKTGQMEVHLPGYSGVQDTFNQWPEQKLFLLSYFAARNAFIFETLESTSVP